MFFLLVSADMGGMMGLTIGASIFSFIEIFGYVAYLARTFIQWIMDGCRRRN